MGFLLVALLRSHPGDPESRLPERLRLAGLINRQQASAARLRQEADALRAEVERARRGALGRRAGEREIEERLDGLRLLAGLRSVRGPGLRVVLDDAEVKVSPRGNVNDLVIHSQDVQAVVNGLWRAGAEAMAINRQRLVTTSAVLCVGNTLLLNGTVQSPPYEVVAVAADRSRFLADPEVRRFRADADAFGLGFSVSDESQAVVPAFEGASAPQYAKPRP